MNDIVKKILENPELTAKLKEAWNSGASIEELLSIAASMGVVVDAPQVEGLLQTIQVEMGDRLADQEIDDEELRAVAGGGSGICDGSADCDDWFKAKCIGMGRRIPSKKERCQYEWLCDQFYSNI